MFPAYEREMGRAGRIPDRHQPQRRLTMLKPTVLAVAILLGGTAARAAVLVSPPLRMTTGDQYECAVVNSGTKDLSSAVIDVTISGSTIGSGFETDCGPVPV